MENHKEYIIECIQDLDAVLFECLKDCHFNKEELEEITSELQAVYFNLRSRLRENDTYNRGN